MPETFLFRCHLRQSPSRWQHSQVLACSTPLSGFSNNIKVSSPLLLLPDGVLACRFPPPNFVRGWAPEASHADAVQGRRQQRLRQRLNFVSPIRLSHCQPLWTRMAFLKGISRTCQGMNKFAEDLLDPNALLVKQPDKIRST